MVKICHLYENVQNRPHNNKKLRSRMGLNPPMAVVISSSIIEIETRLFHLTICFRYQ